MIKSSDKKTLLKSDLAKDLSPITKLTGMMILKKSPGLVNLLLTFVFVTI